MKENNTKKCHFLECYRFHELKTSPWNVMKQLNKILLVANLLLAFEQRVQFNLCSYSITAGMGRLFFADRTHSAHIALNCVLNTNWLYESVCLSFTFNHFDAVFPISKFLLQQYGKLSSLLLTTFKWPNIPTYILYCIKFTL